STRALPPPGGSGKPPHRPCRVDRGTSKEREFGPMSELLIFNAGSWHSAAIAPPLSDVQVVPPAPWDEASPGKCFRNVQTIIDRHGGEPVYGWALTDFGPHRAFGG